MMGKHRKKMDRVSLYFEPRLIWVGVTIGVEAYHICLIPTIVIKVRRKKWSVQVAE